MLLPRETELALIEDFITSGRMTIITLEMKQAHDEEKEKLAFNTQSERVKRTKPQVMSAAPKRNQQIKELTKI